MMNARNILIWLLKQMNIKMNESKVKQAQIKQLLAKTFPIKFTQYGTSTVNTCKHKMIEFGINN